MPQQTTKPQKLSKQDSPDPVINNDLTASTGLAAKAEGNAEGNAVRNDDSVQKAEDGTKLYPTFPNTNGEEMPVAPRKIPAPTATESTEVTGADKNSVTVEQWNVTELNGGMVEVPNTRRQQVYRKEIFDQMKESRFFEESKIQYREV